MGHKPNRLASILAAIALLAAIPAMRGQLITGTVTGTVMDESAAVVAGANLRLTNEGTGVSQLAKSDEAGNFRFLLLPSGTYRIEASSPGFKTFRREGIIVEVDRSVAVPVSLQVGSVTDTVEVQGGTPLLETTTSTLGAIMDQKKVEDLPLNGRNPMGLANLIPTVRGIGYFSGQVLSSWRLAAVSIGGGYPLANGYLVDGIANDKMINSGPMTFFTVDATQEFKVETNAMSAEFGRTGGGIISIVSKSGTNNFHGSLFDYLRNDKLNANDFFGNKAGRPRGAVRVNQFGATLGGPIKHEKLFFFANYEGYRERRFQQKTVTSPTALERSGDFSDTRMQNGALITIYDPTTTVTDPASPGRYRRTAFANNVIPVSRLSAAGRNVLTYYPTSNLPGLPFTHAQNLFLQAGTPIDKEDIGIRMDYNLTTTRRLSGRYSWDSLDWSFANFFGNVAEVDGRHVLIPRHGAFLQYTDALTPTLLMDAKIGFNRQFEHFTTPSAGFDITKLGLPASFKAAAQSGRGFEGGVFPRFSVADLDTFGNANAAGNPSVTGSASVALTKIRGPHSIKTGFEHRLYSRNDYGADAATGNFTFNRGFTQGPDPQQGSPAGGYGVASLLLGTPGSGLAGITTDSTTSLRTEALFLQDDWTATSRLTLNLGLRWEYEGVPTDRYNVFSNFDPSVASPLKAPGLDLRGGLVFPGANGLDRGLTEQHFHDFGPRFGFAYRTSRKMVVRGGYGILYIPTTGGDYTRTGFNRRTPMVTTLDNGLTPMNRLDNPFPTGLDQPSGSTLGALTGVGADVSGQLRNVQRGYSQQWNLTVQYEPLPNWLVEAAWVGNHGTRLLMLSRALNVLPDQYLAMGTQLTQSVSNPFAGIIATGPLSFPTVTRRQLLLPFPQFTSAGVSGGVTGGYSFLGNSIYHAFALKVEKRFSRGFSLLAAYTKSKLIDDGQNLAEVRPGATNTTLVQNWNNLRGERAKSVQDVPQRLVLTALWDVPLGRSGSALYRRILGGWQLNAITTIESGTPISLGLNTPIAGSLGNRPNVVPGAKAKIDNPTLSRWFNTDAFAPPPAFTFGNVSRTLPDIHSDGLFNLDLSVFKNIPIRERWKLQFRAEAFNFTNTPTFDTPGRIFGSATFGVVTATAFNPKPREIQLALRLLF